MDHDDEEGGQLFLHCRCACITFVLLCSCLRCPCFCKVVCLALQLFGAMQVVFALFAALGKLKPFNLSLGLLAFAGGGEIFGEGRTMTTANLVFRSAIKFSTFGSRL